MRTTFASAADLPKGFWIWPHIDPVTEWACQGSGVIVVDTDFLDRFERLRAACGFPLPITSGYRSPAHNAEVSSTGLTGPHTTAEASDIGVTNPRAGIVVREAIRLGFTGIGVSQRAGRPRFIHVDTSHEMLTIWSY